MISQNKTRDKKESAFTRIARFIKYNKIFILFIIILSVLLFSSLFGSKGLIYRLKLESEKKELEKQMQGEMKKGEELQKEIEELKNSDKKIEEVAREKYKMTKEGEKIYKVIVDSTEKK